jgi:hypothetical protein
MSASNVTTNNTSFTSGLDLSGSASSLKSALSGLGLEDTSKAYAALASDCKDSASSDDAESKSNGCVDSMLNTKVDKSDDNDAVIAKDKNGNSCPTVEYTVDASGSCVMNNDLNTTGTIKSNPGGFIQKSMKDSDTYQSSTPSLMDILSMVVNRVVLPGYYINSDFQNYTGEGNKVAPYSGSKGTPADIGKAADERTSVSKDSSDSTAHMYAWRDMECKTGLTDVLTGKTGTPTLNTSNCDIPNISTEAVQSLASLVTSTGLQNAQKNSAKTPFGLGYSSDLLPTSDVPISASQRTDKYTALELFGYNLNWTSYAGEFDRINVMSSVRFSANMSLGNALKVAGNALSAFGEGYSSDAASDWGKFTDSNNDWWSRASGFFGFINPVKHLAAGFSAAGYSLLSDMLYSVESSSTETGSWYRPDFVSQTVYGVRELTSIEQTALTAFKTKAGMWSEISKHTLDQLDFNAYYAAHAVPAEPTSKAVTPDSCDDKDKEDKKDDKGNVIKDADGNTERQCKKVQQVESWSDYKKSQDVDSKASAIGLDASKYDAMNGDATVKYKAMASDWPAAMKAAAQAENEKTKQTSYNNQIDGIIGDSINTYGVVKDMNNIGKWYCVDGSGNPEGKSTNQFVQLAVQQGMMSDPGKEAFNAQGEWQCSSNQPRPTIIGGLYGSAHKGNDDAYKDTRRQAYQGVNIFNILVGNNVDKLGSTMLSVSQNVIMVLNTLVGWSFTPILDKIGFTDLAKKMIKELRESVYMQFIVIFIGIAGLMVILKLVKGQPVQSFQQLGLIILSVFLGFMLLFNTAIMFKVVDDVPTAVERAAIGTIFSSSGEDKICSATGKPAGTLSAGVFEDLFGKNTGYNPDAQVRVLQCRIWETFVLTPWSYGQFGSSINQLYATGYSTSEGVGNSSGEFSVSQSTSDLVGNAAVDMGANTTLHNWGIYQLAHTTSGTISTEDSSSSARTIDKNMYKLVDLQAGPNNAKGRDTSRWSTWNGSNDNKFMIGLTALPAAILGLIAIGGLALKKIQYSVMSSLLLLISPFMLLFGVLPGKGQMKLKSYCFEIISLMIKRVMTVVFMSLGLEVMIEIANGSNTSWTTVCIGLYALCLMIIFHADELIGHMFSSIDKRRQGWDEKEQRMMNAATNNTFMNTMKQNAHDIFVGGAGAAIGLVLAGSAGDENSRRKVRDRLNKQMLGSNGLIKRSANGDMTYDGDGIVSLDLSRVMAGNGTNFQAHVGSETRRIATLYAGLQSSKQNLDDMRSRAQAIQLELTSIKHDKSASAVARRAELKRQLAALNMNISKAERVYQAKRKNYISVQNAYLSKTRLMSTMDQSDLSQQLAAARGKGGKAAAEAVGNVMSNKMKLALKERNREDVYDSKGLTVDDISLATEASFRIDRIMHRSKLSRLRKGQSNFLLEMNSDMNKELSNQIKQSQYELMNKLHDGYYGVDERGEQLNSLSDAIGINGVTDDEITRIIASAPNPMMLESDIDLAIQSGDWRQVRAGIGDILNNERLVDAKIADWKYSPDEIDYLVNAQLSASGKDLASATLREEDLARQKVISNIDSTRAADLEGIKYDMAYNNVVDRFDANRKAAFNDLLGPEYQAALADEATDAGRARIKNTMQRLGGQLDNQLSNINTQRETLRQTYGDDVNKMLGQDKIDYDQAMSKLDDEEKRARQQFTDASRTVVKSKAMEAEWEDIAQKRIQELRQSHDPSSSKPISDKRYEEGVDKIVALSARVKTAEGQLDAALMAVAYKDAVTQSGSQYDDIQQRINGLDQEKRQIKVERIQLVASSKKVKSDMDRLSKKNEQGGLTQDERTEFDTLAARRSDINDQLTDNSRRQSSLSKRSSVYQDEKSDMIKSAIDQRTSSRGSIIDPSKNYADLSDEVKNEMESVINGNDSQATRFINGTTVKKDNIHHRVRDTMLGDSISISSESARSDADNVLQTARVSQSEQDHIANDEKDYTAISEGLQRSEKPSRRSKSNWTSSEEAKAYNESLEVDKQNHKDFDAEIASSKSSEDKAWDYASKRYDDAKQYWRNHGLSDADADDRASAEAFKGYNDILDQTHSTGQRWSHADTTITVNSQDDFNEDAKDKSKTFNDFLHEHMTDRQAGSYQPGSAAPSTANTPSFQPLPKPSGSRPATSQSSTSNNQQTQRASSGSSSNVNDIHKARNLVEDNAKKFRRRPPIGKKDDKISKHRVHNDFTGEDYYVVSSKDEERDNTIITDDTLRKTDGS